MSFDPSTAYVRDYRWMDFVEDVSWEVQVEGGVKKTTGLKAVFRDISTPELIAVAAGLGLSSEAVAITVWDPKPDDVSVDDWQPAYKPMLGHLMRRGPEHGNQGWVVQNVEQSPFKAKWALMCELERRNG